jgi:hypothetical protein
MSSIQSNQVSHIPPYYYFSQDQQERLNAQWQKRSSSKRRGLRSRLSRRSAGR